MATEIKTWQVLNGTLHSVSSTLLEGERFERELEEWIQTNSEILGTDIAIFGRQVQTRSGSLDFLGIDESGNIVVVELKRDRLPREVLSQAIDYAADISTWDIEKFSEVCQKFKQVPLFEFLTERFPDTKAEELAINQTQRILLVGFSIDESLSRMIDWLSTGYSMGVNAILLSYFKTQGGEELLSRTVVIPEQIDREKANRKKFIIEMSDTPGVYEDSELKKKLVKYLSEEFKSPQRIRDYFIPVLLERGRVTREEMQKEFVDRGGATDAGRAGSYLALISSQLGMRWNDFLRQVIGYEPHPEYSNVKLVFWIREGYEQLLSEILEELSRLRD